MTLNEKLTKNQKLRGLKLRGLTWNQINNPYFIYKNDQRKKIDTFNDFETKTPTHMDATHAISKSERNFQNRFPRELDENFDTPRISLMNWISFNFMKRKNAYPKKLLQFLIPEFSLGIWFWKMRQPSGRGKLRAWQSRGMANLRN